MCSNSKCSWRLIRKKSWSYLCMNFCLVHWEISVVTTGKNPGDSLRKFPMESMEKYLKESLSEFMKSIRIPLRSPARFFERIPLINFLRIPGNNFRKNLRKSELDDDDFLQEFEEKFLLKNKRVSDKFAERISSKIPGRVCGRNLWKTLNLWQCISGVISNAIQEVFKKESLEKFLKRSPEDILKKTLKNLWKIF